MTKTASSKNARLTSFLRQALLPQWPRILADSGRVKQLCAAAMVTGVIIGANDAQAQTFTWADTSNSWNVAGSWNPAPGIPDNFGETAVFGAAAGFVAPVIDSVVDIDGITFSIAAPAYTISTTTGDLFLSGSGITNSSAFTQTITNTGGNTIAFDNNATAGSGITINNSSASAFLAFNFFVPGAANAGTATINNGGTQASIFFDSGSSAAASTINNTGDLSTVFFFGQSSAGSATINNDSATGFVNFLDSATAAGSTINNSADFTQGGGVQFSVSSTAGNAVITNIAADSNTDFSDTTSAGSATIVNLGDASNTTFQVNATASNAVITNAGAVSYIYFSDASTAGSSTLVNSGADTLIVFDDSTTAGNATISNSGSASTVTFFLNSNAGSSTIINAGTDSTTFFSENSSAMNATVINSGGNSATIFSDTASGGSAALVNANATAIIDISQLTTPGTTAGSIAGNGSLFLGSKNLTVGSNNTSTTFSGIIQDGGFGAGTGGSLTKVGGGTLTLTGVNTYTGDTTVDGGALIINGSIASANTYVNSAGLLGGTGIIGGNLINGGVVLPGNSPTGFTVVKNYTQTSGGDLRIPIASNSTFGKLKVGGTATLAGSVTAVSVNGFKPEAGDTFTFLTAGGGVNGQFDELNDGIFDGNTILSLGLVYSANSVSLEVVQGSFGDFAEFAGLTPNQKSVAHALDEVAFDSRERRMIAYLNGRSLSDLPGDFDLIAPDELASIYHIGFALANVQTLNLQRRTDDIRNGSRGFSAAGLAMQGTGPGYSGPVQFRTGAAGAGGPTGNEGKDTKAVAPVEDTRWGVFLSGVGEWIDVDGDGNARGYDIATGGFTLGIDYKVTPNFAVGLSAGYAGTGADLTGDGRVFVNGAKVGLYSTYFDGGFYVDAGVMGGYNNYDTKRHALQGTARGDTDGLEFNAVLGGGYDFQFGNFKIGPTATVQYTYVEIDEFEEHGSLSPLRIVDQNAESLRTAIGFRTSYNIQLRNGMIIRPEVRASWQHEFGDQAFALDSQFASGAGSVFTVHGPEYGRDSLLLSAGVAMQLTERTSIYLSYDAQLARRNYESHSISGGIRVAY